MVVEMFCVGAVINHNRECYDLRGSGEADEGVAGCMGSCSLLLDPASSSNGFPALLGDPGGGVA